MANSLGLILANRAVVLGAIKARDLLDISVKAEASRAFDTVWVGDSLLAKPRLESVTLLSALAGVTERVRLAVGCMATFVHRHPVMLAKELATIDLLSGGRLEWGMGAGWFPSDYEQSGLPMDPAGVRVGRLDEAITVMKHLFGDGTTNHQGIHYRVSRLDGSPKPVQRPHPPLMIGAAGDRMLGIAARRAGIVGVAQSVATAKVFGDNRTPYDISADRQLARVRRAAGDRYERLEISMTPSGFSVTDDGPHVRAIVAEQVGVAPERIESSPHHLIGTVDEIVEAIEERRARWDVSYWVIPSLYVDEAAPVVARLAGR